MSTEMLTAITNLRRFIGPSQLAVMVDNTRGEEGEWFRDKILEMYRLTQTMPKTYEQDGKGMEAVAHLHYFTGSGDWWITERDMEPIQHQAFGLACPFGDDGELGYISIVELIQAGAELDLHWHPKALAAIRGEKETAAATI